MSSKKILYITYDGLCDQLGQSQILPYLTKLNKNYSIKILSYEKISNLSEDKISYINENFKWTYKYFKKNISRLKKFIEYVNLFIELLFIIKKNKIEICHCRGYVPALIIYFTSFFFNIKIIFDIRGFWPEEKIDNKQIKIEKKIDYLIFWLMKLLERKIIKKSNHIVVLTDKAKKIISKKNNNITVIPCATDFEKFDNLTIKNSNNLSNILDIKNFKKYKVFCYLGSTTGIYMYREMLRYFKLLKTKNKNVFFLIITKDIAYSEKILLDKKFKFIKNYVKIISLERDQIPLYLNNCYAMIAFIKNSYARNAMSPVKVSEAFASNLPVIINNNIGDIDNHLIKFNIGFSVNIYDLKSIKKSILDIDNLKNKKFLRDEAYKVYDINQAIEKYSLIYSNL